MHHTLRKYVATRICVRKDGQSLRKDGRKVSTAIGPVARTSNEAAAITTAPATTISTAATAPAKAIFWELQG